MRIIKELIEEVKFLTNTEKSQRFTDKNMIRLFDAAQRQIQNVIFNAYPQDPIFADCIEYDRNDQQKYKLPLNKMLTPNSIHALLSLSDQANFSEPLPRVGIIERQKTRGYYLLDGFAYLTNSLGQASRNGGITIVYAKLLPRITSVDQASELPTICEEYLVQWVERKMYHILSSQDVANSQILTANQRNDIASLFADAARDPKYVAILNDEYLAY